jgi:beta-xylosidase
LTIEATPRLTGAPWHDTSKSPAERARALWAEMTMIERLKQLGSTWPGAEDAGGEVAPMQETFARAEAFEDAIAGGVGQLTRPFGTAPITVSDGVERLADLQTRTRAANRFGLPAIAHEECLTGFTAWTATVYPTSLAWGATFDPTLIREMARAIGSDMASVGIHQGLAPVLDVVRDYRWGRVEETIGEDPVLVGEIGAAYVEGLQESGIIATLKHFAGYSASRGARNHAPTALGSREFSEVILWPFERAVRAGARSVMNSYADVDGIPPAASRELLTGILRERWGFTGTLVSDYWAVPFLHSTHRVAGDALEAGRLALQAGMDVELPHRVSFDPSALEGLIAEGTLSADVIDDAVIRVLTHKAELGLLDEDWEPISDSASIDLDSPANRAIARTVAEESVVLLKNSNNALPLPQSVRSIAVIGPIANDAGCLFGCYSFPNHVVPNHPGVGDGIDAPTVLDALRAEFPGASIVYERGVEVIGGDASGIPAAVAAARGADVTILTVGDRSGMFGQGTSGEGCDVISLELPGLQQTLVDAVFEASENVLLVAVTGRPYAIGADVERAAAAVQTFFPGEEGGSAIAGVISGRVNPSGRLPVQIPGASAPQPGTYLAAPLALKSDGVSNVDPTPAFPFGFGLSYTSFAVTDARIDSTALGNDDTVVVETTVRNTGDTAGSHVVQLYLSDPVASVVRPVRRLIGFARVELAAGERAVVRFAVPASVASFPGVDRDWWLEPGEIILTVASSAGDPGQELSVELTGPPTHVPGRQLVEVSIG